MLIREPVTPFDDEAVPVAAGSTALVSWAHDVRETMRGLSQRTLAFHLPNNDRPMGFAIGVMMAVMLYVCAMALLAHFALNHAARGFDDNLKASLTYEVLPDTSNAKDNKSASERAKLLLEKLKNIPGIIKAEIVPDSKIAALLQPWLGDTNVSADLPLPILIDVKLDKNATIDKAALQKASAGMVGVALDDHGAGLEQLVRFERHLQNLAFYVVVLALLSLGLTAYFTAQANFYINRDMIEILHLIGAEDHAIAAHTGSKVLRLSLLAASVALAFAFLTLIGLWVVTRGLDVSFLPNFAISATDWLWLIMQWLLLMGTAVALCFLTSRLTVLRALRKIL